VRPAVIRGFRQLAGRGKGGEKTTLAAGFHQFESQERKGGVAGSCPLSA